MQNPTVQMRKAAEVFMTMTGLVNCLKHVLHQLIVDVRQWEAYCTLNLASITYKI